MGGDKTARGVTRDVLVAIWRAAVGAVHAGRALEPALASERFADEVELLAVGKAASAMAEAARRVLGERLVGGLVTTKDGHGRALPGLELREASHPLPDARGLAAAEAALERAAAAPRERDLLVLVSGGASALWPAPVPGVSLADKRAVTDALLRAGADILQINAVRKHLSRIKGGGLARAAAGRRVAAYLISDVAGDPPDAIGSGPTAPDPTTHRSALAALARHALLDSIPAAARAHLEAGARGRVPETPKPGDACFARVEHRVVATLDDALAAAGRAARERGLARVALGRALDGEAEVVARALAARVLEASGATLFVAGGEPSVRVRGDGRGGRMQHAALAFALAIEGREAIGLFAGTDGSDGPTPAAGAIVDGSTAARARALGFDPAAHLARADASPLLEATGDLLVSGPTDTNVGDIALVWAAARG
jgi:glycerate-2-kinase